MRKLESSNGEKFGTSPSVEPRLPVSGRRPIRARGDDCDSPKRVTGVVATVLIVVLAALGGGTAFAKGLPTHQSPGSVSAPVGGTAFRTYAQSVSSPIHFLTGSTGLFLRKVCTVGCYAWNPTSYQKQSGTLNWGGVTSGVSSVQFDSAVAAITLPSESSVQSWGDLWINGQGWTTGIVAWWVGLGGDGAIQGSSATYPFFQAGILMEATPSGGSYPTPTGVTWSGCAFYEGFLSSSSGQSAQCQSFLFTMGEAVTVTIYSNPWADGSVACFEDAQESDTCFTDTFMNSESSTPIGTEFVTEQPQSASGAAYPSIEFSPYSGVFSDLSAAANTPPSSVLLELTLYNCVYDGIGGSNHGTATTISPINIASPISGGFDNQATYGTPGGCIT